MNKKLLGLYGLKFNPFSPQVPATALWASPAIENFCWRIEQQVGEGGFALAVGDPGQGKSAALRILAERLGNVRDLALGILSRPQAQVADFYRELGHLFSVPLSPHNRWSSAKVLREKWLAHIRDRRLPPCPPDRRSAGNEQCSLLRTALAGQCRLGLPLALDRHSGR